MGFTEKPSRVWQIPEPRPAELPSEQEERVREPERVATPEEDRERVHAS